jgi:O-antigen/teichoic acid export membrane protein
MATKTHTLLFNITQSALLKCLSYALYALSIPLYIAYFKNNDAKTGVWFIIISTCTWLLTFDMGLGNGLRNRLVLLLHRGNRRSVAHAILATYVVNLLLAIVLAAAAAVIAEIVKRGHPNLGFAEGAIYTVVLAVSIQFVVRTITFILYAEQKSGLVGAFNLATNAAMCIFLTWAGPGSIGSMNKLAWAFLVALNGPVLVFSLWRLHRVCSATERRVKWSLRLLLLNGVTIGKSGTEFFSNQLLYLLIVQTTPILIGSLISPTAVVQYTTYSTVFLAVVVVANIVSAPLWSLITKAHHEGDDQWIQSAMIRFVALAGLFALAEISIYVAFPTIVNIWFHGRAAFFDTLSGRTAFLAFSVALIFHTVASTFACGVSELRTQRWFYFGAIVLKVLVCGYMSTTKSDFWGLLLISDAAILAVYSIFELAQCLRAHGKRPASTEVATCEVL